MLSDILSRLEVWLNRSNEGTVWNPLKYHVSKTNKSVTTASNINRYIIRPFPLNNNEKLVSKNANAA